MISKIENKWIIFVIVYSFFFLDNMLLTVVVPIIPDYLRASNMYALLKESPILKSEIPAIYDISPINASMKNERSVYKKSSIVLEPAEKELNNILTGNAMAQQRIYQYSLPRAKPTILSGTDYTDDIEKENAPVGVLLSSKALVQIFLNPVIGMWTADVGYGWPIFVGGVNLIVASLLFAFGDSFKMMLMARVVHGVSSACLGVAGMSLIADVFKKPQERSKFMGAVLGSIALGVLIGYPFGGFLYEFSSKATPFLVIAVLAFFTLTCQLLFLDYQTRIQIEMLDNEEWRHLLGDKVILIATGAIFTSTCAMATLEPCLPIWLMTKLKVEKWQLGAVFLPDSFGYLLGTNFFGVIACKLGQWKVSIVAILAVGISAFVIPNSPSLYLLAVPHFCLGLGIGAIDASLVPMLASLVDFKGQTHYGAVFSLQQMAVSFAYFLAPLIGGALAHFFGFAYAMKTIGFINFGYSFILLWIMNTVPREGTPISDDENCSEAEGRFIAGDIQMSCYNTLKE